MYRKFAYAGLPGTPHSEDWLGYLRSLGDAAFVPAGDLAAADLADVDMLIVDAPWQTPVPEGLTRDRLPMPTILIGNFGTKIGDAMQLKFGTNYGCMCLAEDAIVWNAAHPAFAGLADAMVDKDPPPNFAHYGAILDVPERVATLRILRDATGVPGQATAGFGFLDSPECEIIAGGFNDKSQAHFAIARQGRFLHWGFAGSPSQYTDAGRALLTNCLDYLCGFAHDPIRQSRTASPRTILRMLLGLNGWRGAGLPAEIAALMQQQYLQQLFGGDVPAESFGEQAQRLAWLDGAAAYLRHDGCHWRADDDARAMGFAIDDLALLDACLETADARAARLWQRYTGRLFEDVEAEALWLSRHRPHLYFTEWGGYRWVSQLDPPAPLAPSAVQPEARPKATLGAARYGETVRATLCLEIPAGFHAYAPGAEDGLPVRMTFPDDVEQVEEVTWQPNDGHLAGVVLGQFAVRGARDELAVSLRIQLCDSLTCLPPEMIEVRAPVQPAT